MMRLQKTEMLLIVAALLLGLSSLISPDWLVFTSTLAIAAALVVILLLVAQVLHAHLIRVHRRQGRAAGTGRVL